MPYIMLSLDPDCLRTGQISFTPGKCRDFTVKEIVLRGRGARAG